MTTKRGAGRSSLSSDLSGASISATTMSVIQPVQGDMTVATPKLREKMKRKAQGENELAEIDRAFARHLSMVAEKDEAHSLTATKPAAPEERQVDETPLDLLTADTCLANRLHSGFSKADNSNRLQATSPVLFEQTLAPPIDLELDELKRDIRRIMFTKKPPLERSASSKSEEQKKRHSVSAKTSAAADATDTSDTSAPVARTTKKSDKVPIYKQKSISVEKIPERRRSSAGCGASLDTDSPYNFTDDEEEKEKAEAAKDGNETSTSTDRSNSAAPLDEMKQKILDEEVARKLQQISSLHPELKISGEQKEKNPNDNFLRHVVPKKRQAWQAGDLGATRHLSSEAWMADKDGSMEKYGLKRKSTSSASMFVKTEIITDDYSIAMPSTVRPSRIGQTSCASDKSQCDPDSAGGMDRTLLPKLIIRIPKKCLEPVAVTSSTLSTPNGLNNNNGDYQEGERHHHHHHRKKKKEKRKRHDSDQEDEGSAEDAGKRRKHKRHKGKGAVDECGDGKRDFVEGNFTGKNV